MVIDFTEVKISHLAQEFDRWGESLMSTMLYELLDLYQQNVIEITWEEGMPIPVTPEESAT
tara:strand:- start:809 stop:991 length:183 start_codon:yes stop_codon:yes gene_type:complete